MVLVKAPVMTGMECSSSLGISTRIITIKVVLMAALTLASSKASIKVAMVTTIMIIDKAATSADEDVAAASTEAMVEATTTSSMAA